MAMTVAEVFESIGANEQATDWARSYGANVRAAWSDCHRGDFMVVWGVASGVPHKYMMPALVDLGHQIVEGIRDEDVYMACAKAMTLCGEWVEGEVQYLELDRCTNGIGAMMAKRRVVTVAKGDRVGVMRTDKSEANYDDLALMACLVIALVAECGEIGSKNELVIDQAGIWTRIALGAYIQMTNGRSIELSQAEASRIMANTIREHVPPELVQYGLWGPVGFA